MFLCSSYNPKKNLIANHSNWNLDSQVRQYENFALMEDFNVKKWCHYDVRSTDAKILSKIRPVSKNSINPTCIDLIITNRPKKSLEVIETGLSRFS